MARLDSSAGGLDSLSFCFFTCHSGCEDRDSTLIRCIPMILLSDAD